MLATYLSDQQRNLSKLCPSLKKLVFQILLAKLTLLTCPSLYKTVLFSLLQNLCITASPDASIRVWTVGQQNCSHILRPHDAAVTGISLHATGDYVLSVSADEVSVQRLSQSHGIDWNQECLF